MLRHLETTCKNMGITLITAALRTTLVGIMLILTACGQSNKDVNAEQKTATLEIQPKSAFKDIEWVDLMPREDIEALMSPPEYILNVEEGSLEDQLGDESFKSPIQQNQFPENSPYQQALVSTKIIEKMNGQLIRLPGFIVPLEFDDDLVITQFFLVPFFGACIHVPPPPPNQIIFVNYPKGLTQEALDEPFWMYGVLKTSITENQIATSAYSLELHHFEPYSEN